VTVSSSWCVSCTSLHLSNAPRLHFRLKTVTGIRLSSVLLTAKRAVLSSEVTSSFGGEGKVLPFRKHSSFLSDISSIGDTVLVTYQRADKIEESSVTLIPFYPSWRFVIITYFVGLGIWGVGLYVLWFGWRDLAGRVLHWMMICFASVVMVTWGAAFPTVIERVVRPCIFFLSYEVGIPMFFSSQCFIRDQSSDHS